VAECIELVTLPRWHDKINRTDTCWLWTGAVNKYGYGRVHLVDGPVLAHRVAWVGANGRDIRQGMDLNHLCSTPPCVNPAHLQEATARENLLHGDTLPSQRRARDFCPKGHPLIEGNLASHANGSRDCHTCAKERDRERRKLLTAAAHSLGLTQKQYAAKYGESRKVAQQVLGEVSQ